MIQFVRRCWYIHLFGWHKYKIYLKRKNDEKILHASYIHVCHVCSTQNETAPSPISNDLFHVENNFEWNSIKLICHFLFSRKDNDTTLQNLLLPYFWCQRNGFALNYSSFVHSNEFHAKSFWMRKMVWEKCMSVLNSILGWGFRIALSIIKAKWIHFSIFSTSSTKIHFDSTLIIHMCYVCVWQNNTETYDTFCQ